MPQTSAVNTFDQGIGGHDPQRAPKIDLASVLLQLSRREGSARQEDLQVQTGLDPQTFAATVTAMTSMGLITVSGTTAEAQIVMTPLGVQAVKTLG